jgi:hypothetical protein
VDKKKKGANWTSSQRIQLIESQKNGVKIRTLADFHGVSITAISTQIQKGLRDHFKERELAQAELNARFKSVNDDLIRLTNYSKMTHERLDQTMAFLRKKR